MISHNQSRLHLMIYIDSSFAGLCFIFFLRVIIVPGLPSNHGFMKLSRWTGYPAFFAIQTLKQMLFNDLRVCEICRPTSKLQFNRQLLVIHHVKYMHIAGSEVWRETKSRGLRCNPHRSVIRILSSWGTNGATMRGRPSLNAYFPTIYQP